MHLSQFLNEACALPLVQYQVQRKDRATMTAKRP